ncbi:MAG TPA: hypothetical protein PKH07_10865, partial [bacterium]|nr:hypothetical protein [bacterium]
MPDLPNRRIRILAVDDDPRMLDLYRHVFRTSVTTQRHDEIVSLDLPVPEGDDSLAETFELATASDCESALQVIRASLGEASPVAMAFIEMTLKSDEDGVQIAERIRELDPAVNLVMMTAREQPNLRDLGWRVPPPDKLLSVRKPVESEEILHLASALSAKWNIERQLRRICAELETRIQEGTAELSELNDQLKVKIQEQRLIEDVLRKNEQFLESILDSIQDGITVLDKDMNVLRVNRTIQKWYPQEFPFVGKKCYSTYHGLSEPCSDCPALEAIRKGDIHMEVVCSTDLEGNKRWREVYIFPI